MSKEALRTLNEKIDRIADFVAAQAAPKETLADALTEWLDNDQACAELGMSKRTLQRLRSSGRITYSMTCGRARYTREAIEQAKCGRVYHSTGERNLIFSHSPKKDQQHTNPNTPE